MKVVAALEKLGNGADLVVLDCLTLWVSNLMQWHEHGRRTDSRGGGQACRGAEECALREHRRDR